MDISSMIMGAAVASVMWIGFVPWARLKRLRELEARDATGRSGPGGAGEGPTPAP
ncbi:MULTISPECIES: hypothetical protein [unclassified Pseudoclavibacter]|uniref:hypothetical protein n=1 Tax=unclassified Pseudoclavibacter TaxID=2615177 RepID=UPI0013587174|nr:MULTISPECIES: hypothetical protein [unclassified Pseudoclavibacter]